MTHQRPAPSAYRLQVEGHLDRHWSSWFDDLTLTREDDGTTTMAGPIADQAQLHGLLTKIRDLGVTLISVEVVDATITDRAARPTRATALDNERAMSLPSQHDHDHAAG